MNIFIGTIVFSTGLNKIEYIKIIADDIDDAQEKFDEYIYVLETEQNEKIDMYEIIELESLLQI